MKFSQEWLVPQRVVYFSVAGTFSTTEVSQMADVLLDAIQSGQAPVHLIINARQIENIPASLKYLSEQSQWMRDPKRGWVLLLLPKRSLLTMATGIIMQTFGVQFKQFEQLPEAVEFLQAADMSLAGVSMAIPSES